MGLQVQSQLSSSESVADDLKEKPSEFGRWGARSTLSSAIRNTPSSSLLFTIRITVNHIAVLTPNRGVMCGQRGAQGGSVVFL